MNKNIRTVMKDIMKHKDLEKNLPDYANTYISTAYEYSLIHLVLKYYTLKEVQDETGNIQRDEYLSKVLDRLHTLLFETLFTDEYENHFENVIQEIDTIRKNTTDKMIVLTSYVDTFEIYEYIMNRIEYRIKGEAFDVDEDELAAKVFQYLFNDHDKMVINSKIQLVTGQLPIRMTKNKFFEYLTETLNIYKGSDQSALDDFISLLRTSALLDIPSGYQTDYQNIYELIQKFENVNFKEMKLDEYESMMQAFKDVTAYLTDLVSNYLLIMEIINDLYALLLSNPYQQGDKLISDTCIKMLKGIHDAFISESDIPDFVDQGFDVIIGKQEEFGEDLMKYESVLFDIKAEHADTISWIMLDKIFSALQMIAKLLSNSLFIDLDKEDQEEKIVDADYIVQKKDELIAELSDFFDKHKKEVNRSVMASIFSNMPVLFNSQSEIKEYIEYSLNHCNNQSELMACATILEDMMQEI